MPAVVATEGDLVHSGAGPGDAHRTATAIDSPPVRAYRTLLANTQKIVDAFSPDIYFVRTITAKKGAVSVFRFLPLITKSPKPTNSCRWHLLCPPTGALTPTALPARLPPEH